jgi:hypothetical protein
MDRETARIKARLERVLNSIYCPVHGCWPAHGGHYEYYHESGSDRHVLEVWPAAVKASEKHEGNWYGENRQGQLHELADFEFGRLSGEIPLQHLHFSQRRAVFEIGWREDGLNLALKVHIEPLAMGPEGSAEFDV